MKIRLIRDARIKHKAGEIVEVSPAEANFLLSLNSAVALTEDIVKEAPKKKAKK